MTTRRLSRLLQTAVGVLLAVVVVACFLLNRDNSFVKAEGRRNPINDAERKVAHKLLVNGSDFRFRRWGPHMSRDEIERLPGHPEASPDVAVRLVFTSTNMYGVDVDYDWVFGVFGEKVNYFGYNDHGDAWKEKAKEGKVAEHAALDFAHLKGQLPMERVLDHLGLLAKLRGSGAQRRCTCPIHRGDARGKTFSVNLSENVFQCFEARCGKKGDVIDLWSAVKGLSLREAALDLVRTFHLEPNPRGGTEKRNG